MDRQCLCYVSEKESVREREIIASTADDDRWQMMKMGKKSVGVQIGL